jgi:predicted ArsR family transcriptional regulator
MANELDQVIHQPIRTKIMALLLNSGECDYSTIKNTLNISDGHMSTHMKVLVSEEYVEWSGAPEDTPARFLYLG